MNRACARLSLVAVALVATLASGCFTMNARLPGAIRTDVEAADTEKVGTLSHEDTNYFFLYGLLGAPDENFYVDPIMSQVQAKGGDGVANLKHEASFGCLDLAIGAVTFGCVYPRSYKLTGDIVRVKKAPLPGKPVPSSKAPKAAKTAQAF